MEAMTSNGGKSAALCNYLMLSVNKLALKKAVG